MKFFKFIVWLITFIICIVVWCYVISSSFDNETMASMAFGLVAFAFLTIGALLETITRFLELINKE